MKRLLVPLALIFIITSCAPAAPVIPLATPVPPTTTASPMPTQTMTAEHTSTPEPTATLTVTSFPIPKGAVKAADGSTVYVKEGKLWQLDAQGQAVERDILDVTFANVLDGSEMVRQLHPEYYEDDQKLLKETLLPKGVSVSANYRHSAEGFLTYSGGKGAEWTMSYGVTGYSLDFTRVARGDDSVLIMNTALIGARQPIPVVMGVIKGSGFTPFIKWVFNFPITVDKYSGDWGTPSFTASEDMARYMDALKGERVRMELLASVKPEYADEFYGRKMTNLVLQSEDYRKMAHESATEGIIPVYQEWDEKEYPSIPKKDRPKNAGQVIGKVLENAGAQEVEKDYGFLISRYGVHVLGDN